MGTRLKPLGIFCIEGHWNHDDITDRSTVKPMFEMLEKLKKCTHIHYDALTIEELEFLLNRWATKAICNRYPILYLGFHGSSGEILLNKKQSFALEQISELLKDKCSGKLIYFGSCSTLKISQNRIDDFLKQTKAKGIIGFRKTIPWVSAASIDLMVLEMIDIYGINTRGLNTINKHLKYDIKELYEKLGMTFEIR